MVFQLIGYDFEYQWNQENEAAKSILHSYVDSGNSILQAEDVHLALETQKHPRDMKFTLRKVSLSNTLKKLVESLSYNA